MPIRNILVAIDGTPSSETALASAVAMQQAYDAHLTGYVATFENLRAGDDNSWLPSAIRNMLARNTAEVIEAIEAKFSSATRHLVQEKIHLIERQHANDTSVAEASRFFDVTLVGIPETGGHRTALHPDRIALLSGRPVMAFPHGFQTTGVSRRVMVAWDGSRAAARSLSSAIRLLETKETVTLVTVGGPPQAGIEASGLDPQTSLKRQGIAADWITVERSRQGIAHTILEQAERLQAELLIMGAFEHSKFREDLFGGVTNDVMAKTNIPIFLAH
ncbi:universal stress protein [Ruegeria sp.]|uniref:universal stress protein n=1 Tax=Ruegeria sp. TaxID=1879320 RepID=UPI00230A5086|nr:universal stress protein [Ruegeria sp.]MDA7967108.1 universal stress protein [Ruegeria sp.]